MLGMGFDRFSTTLCVRSLCHPQQRWRDTKGLAARALGSSLQSGKPCQGWRGQVGRAGHLTMSHGGGPPQ